MSEADKTFVKEHLSLPGRSQELCDPKDTRMGQPHPPIAPMPVTAIPGLSREDRDLLEKYPAYFKDVSHLRIIDIYRVLDLFNVTDQAVGHAVKKLLLSGARTGGKDVEKDIGEAMDALKRRAQMKAENERGHTK